MTATTGSVCTHIRKFYAHIATEPPVYWSFDTEELGVEVSLDPVASDRGDKCHHNLRGMTNGQAKEKLLRASADDFEVCANGKSDKATPERLAELAAALP